MANPMAGMPGMPQMPAGMNPAEMMNNPGVQEMMKNPDIMKMAQDMMQGGANGGQPNMQDLMSKPEMMNSMINMMKDNPAMINMVKQQFPGSSDEDI